MFCSNCKTEYREGFSKCSDCGADLVRELPKLAVSNTADFAELIWMGSNPQTLAAVKKLLTDAKIQFSSKGAESRMLFASALPRIQISVLSSDLVRARMLIDDRFVESDEDFETPETEVSDDIPEREPSETHKEEAGAASDLPGFVPEDWDPVAAHCSVWKGFDLDLAENLCACLIENGIGSQIISDGGSNQLMIYPADEFRAREIIREIVEATPPA